MKKLIFLLLPILFTGCSYWYSLTRTDSTYYTADENLMLDETTKAIDFRYGFDPDLELDYVYRAGTFSDKDLDAKSKKMLEVLKKYDKAVVIAFYEKIYKLNEIIVWTMGYCEREKEWTEYTLIQKYILPDTRKYLEILEKNVLLIDVNYKKIIEERKGEIKKQVEAERAED